MKQIRLWKITSKTLCDHTLGGGSCLHFVRWQQWWKRWRHRTSRHIFDIREEIDWQNCDSTRFLTLHHRTCQGLDPIQGGNSHWSAAAHICWKAAWRWHNPLVLQYTERIYPTLGHKTEGMLGSTEHLKTKELTLLSWIKNCNKKTTLFSW